MGTFILSLSLALGYKIEYPHTINGITDKPAGVLNFIERNLKRCSHRIKKGYLTYYVTETKRETSIN